MELGLGGCCGDFARSIFLRRVRFLGLFSFFLPLFLLLVPFPPFSFSSDRTAFLRYLQYHSQSIVWHTYS